jgi:hypothetical protein
MGNAKIRKDIWSKQKSQIKLHLNGSNDEEDDSIYSIEEEILRATKQVKSIKKPKKKEWL